MYTYVTRYFVFPLSVYPSTVNRMKTFETSREIPASAEDVFAAFSDPHRLAKWWGPAGFTNTFHICEFKTGGRWSFIMHGPNGANFQNDSIFEMIEAPSKVIIQHESKPRYRLVIMLTPSKKGTAVSWAQTFESEDMASRVEHIVVPANEQNLDRLTAEVMGSRFLSLIGAPARRALEREGITTLNALARYTEKDLLKLHGMGPSSIPKLASALAEEGLSFSGK